MFLILIPLLLLLSLNTEVDLTNKVVDWPVLEEHVNVVSYDTLQQRCSKYAPIWVHVKACSIWDFNKGTFDTYVESNAPASILEHEHLHYLGYDHYNSKYMRDNLEEWRQHAGR